MPGQTADKGPKKVPKRSEVEIISTSTVLDSVDRRIVELLQRDGRRPYGAIAKDVGLSEAAVRRRVQRLRHPCCRYVRSLLRYGRVEAVATVHEIIHCKPMLTT